MRGARLARGLGDPALADRLEKEAAELKLRFNRDYWLADGSSLLSLSTVRAPSRLTHLQHRASAMEWDRGYDKAEACVAHLMSDKLFTGWGIRTMAEGEGGYNPIGYHVGTVWPFDNSFIAMGLRRYGYQGRGSSRCHGILDAASYFNDRLPEAFGGYRGRARSSRSNIPLRAARRHGRQGRRSSSSHTARARTNRGSVTR